MSGFAQSGPRWRRGLTLVELLITATITAMTLAAGATMISAVSNAANQTRDTRSTKKAGQMTADRISSLVRQARGIGEVTSTSVLLWDVDRNDDEVVNLHETSLLTYDSNRHLLILNVTTPSSENDVGPALAQATYESVSLWETRSKPYSPKEIVLAEGIEGFAFSGYPNNTETRIVNFEFSMDATTEWMQFRESVTPRATADYLFDDNAHEENETAGKPSRRTEYSRWTGWADLDGDAVVYPSDVSK